MDQNPRASEGRVDFPNEGIFEERPATPMYTEGGNTYLARTDDLVIIQ